MDNRLKELEKQYKDVPIPKELDAIVEASLQKKPKKFMECRLKLL